MFAHLLSRRKERGIELDPALLISVGPCRLDHQRDVLESSVHSWLSVTSFVIVCLTAAAAEAQEPVLSLLSTPPNRADVERLVGKPIIVLERGRVCEYSYPGPRFVRFIVQYRTRDETSRAMQILFVPGAGQRLDDLLAVLGLNQIAQVVEGREGAFVAHASLDRGRVGIVGFGIPPRQGIVLRGVVEWWDPDGPDVPRTEWQMIDSHVPDFQQPVPRGWGDAGDARTVDPVLAVCRAQLTPALADAALGKPIYLSSSGRVTEYSPPVAEIARLIVLFPERGGDGVAWIVPSAGVSASLHRVRATLGLTVEYEFNWSMDWFRATASISNRTHADIFGFGGGYQDPRRFGLVFLVEIRWPRTDRWPSLLEDGALGAFKYILSAQGVFSGSDLNRNGIVDRWAVDVSGLYRMESGDRSSPIGVLPEEIALADACPLADGRAVAAAPFPDGAPASLLALGARRPYGGYWLAAIPLNEDGVAIAQDVAKNGQAWTSFYGGSYCAFPSSYGDGTRRTFIFRGEGHPYYKDLGGARRSATGPASTRPRRAGSRRWIGEGASPEAQGLAKCTEVRKAARSS